MFTDPDYITVVNVAPPTSVTSHPSITHYISIHVASLACLKPEFEIHFQTKIECMHSEFSSLRRAETRLARKYTHPQRAAAGKTQTSNPSTEGNIAM